MGKEGWTFINAYPVRYNQGQLNNPEYTIEYIASQCGFKTARQLHRVLKQ